MASFSLYDLYRDFLPEQTLCEFVFKFTRSVLVYMVISCWKKRYWKLSFQFIRSILVYTVIFLSEVKLFEIFLKFKQSILIYTIYMVIFIR